MGTTALTAHKIGIDSSKCSPSRREDKTTPRAFVSLPPSSTVVTQLRRLQHPARGALLSANEAAWLRLRCCLRSPQP